MMLIDLLIHLYQYGDEYYECERGAPTFDLGPMLDRYMADT